MTKKQRKRTQQSFTNPIDTMGDKPDGEDFFAFAVIIDDPTNPNWNDGCSCVGPWDKAKALAGAAVNSWVNSKPRLGKRIMVAMYQGDGARQYLMHSMKEELRYQREVQSN